MNLCWSIKGVFFSLKIALKAKVAAKKDKSLHSAASQETAAWIHLSFILGGKTSDLQWRRISLLPSNEPCELAEPQTEGGFPSTRPYSHTGRIYFPAVSVCPVIRLQVTLQYGIKLQFPFSSPPHH